MIDAILCHDGGTGSDRVIIQSRPTRPRPFRDDFLISIDEPIPPAKILKPLIYFNENSLNPLYSNSSFIDSINSSSKLSSDLLKNPDLQNYHKFKSTRFNHQEDLSSSYLVFDSNFESGNLLKVYQHSEKEFVLILREDFSNQKYSHWFYFSVKPEKLSEATFHIVNIQKQDSALAEGMQIVAKEENKWQRSGKNIIFRKNCKFLNYTNGIKSFCLSFSYDFTSTSKIFFAYSYPYTYTDLEKSLSLHKKSNLKILKIENICKSLSGLDLPVITITNNVHSDFKSKKIIVFIGRVHPSEAPSSHIVSGMLSFLLSKSEEAEKLRNTFVYIIVPMINPDGVKYGNTRCSLLGVDLNRRWPEPVPHLHPEVYSVKKMIQGLHEKYGIFMICDIHSHAKKKNVFMYGCNSKKSDKISKEINNKAKIVPLLLSKHNSHFSLKDSHFKMDKSKESTARIVMFRQLGIVNSYTVETSFFGSEFQKIFEVNDWEKIGQDLAKIGFQLMVALPLAGLAEEDKEKHVKAQRRKALSPKNKLKTARVDGFVSPFLAQKEKLPALSERKNRRTVRQKGREVLMVRPFSTNFDGRRPQEKKLLSTKMI